MLAQQQIIHNQLRHFVRAAIRFLTYLCAFFLASIAYWVTSNFGKASIEQVLYHAQFGVGGLVDTDIGIVRSFVTLCLLVPIVSSLLLVLIEYSIALTLIYRSTHWFAKPMQVFNLRGLKVFYWFIGHRAPLYSLIISCVYFAFQFSISAFVHNQFGEDYFGKHYIDPKTIKIDSVKPKNLMLIYVESLEDTYKDNAIFGKNLLKSLDKLKGVSFTGFKQAPGTHWTIAGITASQCGLPLKNVSLYDGNNQGENIQSFLPNAVCLGDILHDAGYHNVYMGGDALAFAGKGKFFQDHHYDEVYGREELKQGLSAKDMNFWGLYDDDLFVLVKAKLKQLHAKSQPFNLTMTTIDTHGPDGHFSKYCKKRGVTEFKGIVECTSNQVANFVQFMQKSGYLKDTNVVILGDHLAMFNPVNTELNSAKQRFIFNRFISNQLIKKNREDILHFDLFPTILEFIGFKLEGGKLGLGFSGISNDVDLPPASIYKDMQKDLLNNSEKYLALWRQK